MGSESREEHSSIEMVGLQDFSCRYLPSMVAPLSRNRHLACIEDRISDLNFQMRIGMTT